MSTAQHTPEQVARIANECEAAFQKGGPRVYTVEANGRILPSGMGAKSATRCAFDDQTVYARRKVGTRYEWVAIAKATGSAA